MRAIIIEMHHLYLFVSTQFEIVHVMGREHCSLAFLLLIIGGNANSNLNLTELPKLADISPSWPYQHAI